MRGRAYRFAAPPHPAGFVVHVGEALSHRGRGRSHERRERKKFGRRPKMPIKYDELMALKKLGQKYA
jgi:hypothetical protein